METELLRIFDENRNQIGISTRAEVHRHGYWHETFHCWLISRNKNKLYIYFQLRSAAKKDYPNLLDITAAGHLLVDESVADGVREVKEEIGIEVQLNDLRPLGVIPYSNKQGDFIDNELAHAYLLEIDPSFEDFVLQKAEVSGIVKVNMDEFYELWFDKRDYLHVEGFEINAAGERQTIHKLVGKEAFVPHEDRFYKDTLLAIYGNIEKARGTINE